MTDQEVCVIAAIKIFSGDGEWLRQPSLNCDVRNHIAATDRIRYRTSRMFAATRPRNASQWRTKAMLNTRPMAGDVYLDGKHRIEITRVTTRMVYYRLREDVPTSAMGEHWVKCCCEVGWFMKLPGILEYPKETENG